VKRHIPALLVFMLLLSACGSGGAPTPYELEPLPTPGISFQVVGSTKYNAMVVVDSAASKDREGLLEVGNYLCKTEQKCKVWFWDDIQKADTSFPVDEDQLADVVAFYSFSFSEAEGVIEVYTLGDPRP